MTSIKLKRIELETHVKDRLLYHNFSTCKVRDGPLPQYALQFYRTLQTKDVLCRTPLELVRLLGLGYPSVKNLQLQVSRACAPQPSSVLEMRRRTSVSPKFLSTSLDELDKVLHGGLPVATITEVAGPSGCGKTQFSMMMSVLAVLPVSQGGLDGGVVYIDTESAFSAERLVEIIQSKFSEISDEELSKLTLKIHVMNESTCKSLLHRLENIEDFLITHNIKFLVIDSIASLVRKEFDSRIGKNIIARTNLLSREASILKKIAEDFSMPVLVTNQITTRYNSGPQLLHSDESDILSDEGGYVTVALGNTWSHCVNTRLILQYLDDQYRQILVAKSPVAPFANFIYTIQPSGFVLEDETGHHYEGTDPGLQRIRVRTSLPHEAFMY